MQLYACSYYYSPQDVNNIYTLYNASFFESENIINILYKKLYIYLNLFNYVVFWCTQSICM